MHSPTLHSWGEVWSRATRIPGTRIPREWNEDVLCLGNGREIWKVHERENHGESSRRQVWISYRKV